MIFWLGEPDNTRRIRIVDKTVPHPNYREHDALIWVLNHGKTSPVDHSGPWLKNDYIGYHPTRITSLEKHLEKFLIEDEVKLESSLPQNPDHKSKAINPMNFFMEKIDKSGNFAGDFYVKIQNEETIIGESLTRQRLEPADILYITDTYGVYIHDYVKEDFSTHLDYSKVIFGGFDLFEVKVMEQFASIGGNIIAEFNSFASPTHGEARRRMEKLFGVKWTEWTGRFFNELSDFNEVPAWAKRNWKKHYNEEWNFKGPGWLITHEDTRLFVLVDGQDVLPKGLLIKDVKTDDSLMQDVFNDVPFRFWFDFIIPEPGSEVLAKYHFHLSSSGKELFSKFGLPEQFPAVTRASKSPLRIYFSGDFSDNDLERGPYYMAWITKIKNMFRFQERYIDQSAFFWEFYVPMMKNILVHTPRLEN